METQLTIDNITRPARSGRTFTRRGAVSGEVVTTAAAATVDDALDAARSAERAFQKWSQTGPSERRMILLRAADALESKLEAFRSAMALEIGAAEAWADFNVAGSAALFREAAALATQIQGETIPTDKPGALSMTLRQPVGVILSIVPWNGPVLLAARAIAYPLVCGNTVIFRASENSPRTHALIAEALIEAGLPAGVLNFLTNAPEDAADIIDVLIAHPAVRRINFTGSTRVGRIIAEKAARHLKPCLLELGGKAPFVVLDDADIEAASAAAVFGAFLYQGQICMSTERFVVDESIAEVFVARFAERALTLSVGDPAAGELGVIGPVISQTSGTRINGLLDDALSKGAVLACGGPATGAVMPATIVDHVAPGMAIYDEETFGPITTIVRVRGVDEAVRVANDTPYGLSASVFGRDVARALNVAKRIESGAVHVNGATVQNEPQAPYGGMKQSGYGRFDGRAVIDQFTELKWVTVEPAAQPYPF